MINKFINKSSIAIALLMGLFLTFFMHTPTHTLADEFPLYEVKKVSNLPIRLRDLYNAKEVVQEIASDEFPNQIYFINKKRKYYVIMLPDDERRYLVRMGEIIIPDAENIEIKCLASQNIKTNLASRGIGETMSCK